MSNLLLYWTFGTPTLATKRIFEGCCNNKINNMGTEVVDDTHMGTHVPQMISRPNVKYGGWTGIEFAYWSLVWVSLESLGGLLRVYSVGMFYLYKTKNLLSFFATYVHTRVPLCSSLHLSTPLTQPNTKKSSKLTSSFGCPEIELNNFPFFSFSSFSS